MDIGLQDCPIGRQRGYRLIVQRGKRGKYQVRNQPYRTSQDAVALQEMMEGKAGSIEMVKKSISTQTTFSQ